MKCDQDHEHGAKCGVDMMPMVGATSWADVDAQHAAHEAAEAVSEAAAQFQSIVTSILYDPNLDPDAKTQAIQAAAAELPARMRREMNGKRSILDRVLGRNKATDKDGLGPDAYAVVPDPEIPSTWKLRIDDAAHISGAIQALSPAGYRGQRAELDDGERAEAIRKIGAAIKRLPEADRGNLPDRLAALKALDEPSRPGAVAIMGDRFVMWASNNFRDREGEYFPAEGMRAAVDRFNARQAPRGFANVLHVGHPQMTPGLPREASDWGEIERAGYTDGFVLVEGRVTDPAVAAKIAEWGSREDLGTSWEYQYMPWDLDEDTGVYSSFDFDRVSVLPRSKAANPWTPDLKGDDMFDAGVRTALVTLYGDDKVKEWETAAAAKGAELEAAGLDRKEIKMQLPTPEVVFIVDEAKDADETAPTEAAAVEPTAEPETPAWAKALADQNAAILARLDQTDAAVKAVTDELAGAAPAVGVLGRSVQGARFVEAQASKELADQDAAVDAYRATGTVPDPSMVGATSDWGIAGRIAAGMMGSNGQTSKPAGA